MTKDSCKHQKLSQALVTALESCDPGARRTAAGSLTACRVLQAAQVV